MIAGLGNPGSEYEDTRHNIGFKIVDELSGLFNIPLKKHKFNGLFGKGKVNGETILLVKPLTFMNRSGDAVAPLLDYFGFTIDDLLVIYDDLDLPAGKIRLRQKGSAGGHNGMKSIISQLHSTEYKRLRIGIGRPEGYQPVVNYVLEPFSKEQRDNIKEAIQIGAEACEKWLSTPFDDVMNVYNR